MAFSSIYIPRSVLGLLISSALLFPSIYQNLLSTLYAFLCGTRLYNSSVFETVWTVFIYAIIEPFYTYKFAHNPQLRFAVKESHRTEAPLPKMRRPSNRVMEVLTYVAPLLLMDLTLIKKFAGASATEMAVTGNYNPGLDLIDGNFLRPSLHRFTRNSPLQTRRALPQDAPTSRQLVCQLALSFFIYDAVFFLFHLALHKIPTLNRIHSLHHGHAEINPQITNKLGVIERLGLVMLANFSLNIIGSHVLTRTLFVPAFVWLLVDIHSGLDQEWGYDKILPAGWAAGSKRHSQHHKYGIGNYEPFFNWWDDALLWVSRDVATERQKT